MAAKKTAAKKTTTTTVVVTPPSEEQEPELDVFDRARLQFSDGPRLRLRIGRYDDGKTAYLKQVDYDPEAIDENWIRKKWGPGSYQLRFIDTENPQNNWSKVIDIASDAPQQSPQAPSSGISDLVSMLQRQNEIMLTALVGKGGTTPAPAGGGSDPAMVELVRGMQAQNTELLRAAMNKPDTSATMLSVFEKGLQLAAEAKMDSEGGWMAQFGRIARELGPMLSEAIKARAENPRPVIIPPAPPTGPTPTTPARALPATTTPTPTPRPNNGTPSPSAGFVRTDAGASPSPSPSPSPTPAAPTSSPPSSSMDDTLNLVDHALQQFAPEILQAAREGQQPRDVADVVLNSLPPMFYPELEKLTAEKVIAIEPQLGQHRQFVAALLAGLKDEGDDGGDDATS